MTIKEGGLPLRRRLRGEGKDRTSMLEDHCAVTVTQISRRDRCNPWLLRRVFACPKMAPSLHKN
jgi:hypothetical protein